MSTISTIPKTLYQSFVRTVLRVPNKPIFHVNETTTITYDKLSTNINNFRNLLKNSGIKKGDNVVIIGNNSHNWASVALAVWAEGGVVVPMYEKQTFNMKKFVINETNPKIVFNSGASVKLTNDSFSEINHDNFVFVDDINYLPDADVSEHDLSSILYTSGTTGNPKGVMLTHSNILSNIESISNSSKMMEINEHDKYVSFLPWAHCYGLNCELNFLISKGASTYLNTNLLNLRKDFLKFNPTVLCGVPKLFTDIDKKLWFGKYLPQFGRKILMKKVFGNNLRFGMVGGASINPDILNYYHDSGIDIYQGYGMTETAPLVSSNTVDQNKVGSVGKLLDCNQTILMNGEIWISGSNVSTGYYKHPNHESFVRVDNKNYYKTGDSGYLDEDGFLFVTGRIKETYKLSNGKFINPDEIERSIITIPEVSQAMVYTKSGDEFNRLIAVTTLNSNDLANLINKLPLDKYKIPKHITITNEPFTLDNGLITPKQSLRRNQIMEYYKL